MSSNPDSTLLNSLPAVQQQVLQALVAGQSITTAAQDAGVHRTTVHLWTRQHAPFAQALLAARQDKADRLLDDLGDLAELAINTFRHLLTDQNASPATRLKAAMEIVKLVESQRPTHREITLEEVKFDKIDSEIILRQVAQAKPPIAVGRNAPCPCRSGLKFKRCCANPPAQNPAAQNPVAQNPVAQARAA